MTIYVEEDGGRRRLWENFQRRHGFFGPSPAVVDALIRARLRARDAATQPSVSMGPAIDRRDIPVGTSGSVPGLRPSPPIHPTAPLSGQTTGIIKTPHQSILPGATPSILPRQTQTGGSRMAFDLGSIIRDLGSQYIETRFGTPRAVMAGVGQGVVDSTRVTSYPSGVGTDLVPQQVFLPAIVAAGGVTGRIAGILGGLGLGLAADEIGAIAGAISKVKCKRRRRRLATHSDIKDLAALSAVLGKGKLLETWVATRRI